MREHSLTTLRTARYFTLGSLDRAAELWIVCHGYGQLASRFLERFRLIADDKRCIVAPEGLSRFYLSESPRSARGCELDDERRSAPRNRGLCQYLDALHNHVAGGKAKVTALGFSQGTATVCRWTVLGAREEAIDRLIVWGERSAGSRPDRSRRRATAQDETHTGVWRTRRVLHAENHRRDRRGSAKHAVPYEVVSYEGGHEIHVPTLRKLL
jgi:predicted esterase